MSNNSLNFQSVPGNRGKPQRRPAAPQGRIKSASDQYATKVMCSRCQITYEVPAGFTAKCPLCDAKEELAQTRAALVESQNHLNQLTEEVGKLRSHVDLVMAMRDSFDLVGPEDMAFLKSVMYRFRDDKSVSLKVTHASSSSAAKVSHKGKRPVANGFVAIVRGGRPEAHLCSSIGGAAVAAYFDEGLRTQGPIATMQNLMRAMNQHLAGAT